MSINKEAASPGGLLSMCAMPALFPHWSNSLLKLGAAMALGTVVTATAAPMVFVRTPYATGQLESLVQPVQFDHRHHAGDEGIDCFYCHFEAKRSRFAGIPPTEVCMGCHGQVWNDSPTLELVRTSYFARTPMRWRRVHALPDFVHFEHSAHVNKGVGCVTCHGRVDLMAGVYQVAPLTMDFCLDCHPIPGPQPSATGSDHGHDMATGEPATNRGTPQIPPPGRTFDELQHVSLLTKGRHGS